jgi:hypothetical protein
MDRYFLNGKALDAFFYKDKTFSSTEKIEQPGATCLAMRRSLIEKIGLFDEQFPIFFNDVDLCKRIWNEGFEIHVLSDAHLTHYGGTNIRRMSKEDRAEQAFSGIYRYFKKHHGWISAMLVYVVFVVGNWSGKVVIRNRS